MSCSHPLEPYPEIKGYILVVFYVIVYDRSAGKQVSLQRFPTQSEAAARRFRFDLERRHLSEGHDYDVVLLRAPSIHSLRRSHARYFEDTAKLMRRAPRPRETALTAS